MVKVKTYKPTTPSRRYMTVPNFDILTKKEPEKALIVALKKKAGRAKGRITVRHRGGGAKRLYRIIDFKRLKFDMKAKVEAIEYDPSRTAFIALIKYEDGEKSYVLAPTDVKVGDQVISSQKKIEANPGNRMLLKYISIGIPVYNIELEPRGGGRIVRSAGANALILAYEDKYVHVKLPSGEIRKVLGVCLATVGQVSNPENVNVVLGKAGRIRWRGRRPKVRGKAMSPYAHPHGGGEGMSPIGIVHPKTPWGKPALGVKTRKKKKPSERLIVKHRLKKRKKK